jgi:pantoate--beta-alanine ligase
MDVFYKLSELLAHLQTLAGSNTIGFVPTMGALHQGHISLVERAALENNTVVCSIFVNPTQFNDPNDLKNYPRTLENDIALLQKSKCDILFAPTAEEIYPADFNLSQEFNLEGLDKVMEGASRPGHFKGVATIVKRLFEIVTPTRAYFGLKDYQQVAVIKSLVKVYNLSVEIVACETIRETDGLAMSSRNRLLTPQAREKAAIIPELLAEIKEKAAFCSIQEIKSLVKEKIDSTPLLKLDYIEISDAQSLAPLNNWSAQGNNLVCIAVFAGNIRLIDNSLL